MSSELREREQNKRTASNSGAPKPQIDLRPAEFHCWHAGNAQEAAEKGRAILQRYKKFLNLPAVVDLGCGDGALLLALKEAGRNDILGVDSNEELLAFARSLQVPLVESDLWDFLARETLAQAVYFYLDVMEHVSLENNFELLRRIPVGSRLIVQTPNTESAMGHRYYMNVPSHVAPYSPWVIKRMFARFGYRLVGEGTLDWEHPPNWKNKLREWVLLKLMGINPELLLGGGNYFAVADRVEDVEN